MIMRFYRGLETVSMDHDDYFAQTFDDKSPFVTSGIRVGTPAMTTRGMKVAESEKVAELIDRVISAANSPNISDICRQAREEIRELCLSFPLDGYGPVL
jgi:glycine hydroxymethyltransferase